MLRIVILFHQFDNGRHFYKALLRPHLNSMEIVTIVVPESIQDWGNPGCSGCRKSTEAGHNTNI